MTPEERARECLSGTALHQEWVPYDLAGRITAAIQGAVAEARAEWLRDGLRACPVEHAGGAVEWARGVVELLLARVHHPGGGPVQALTFPIYNDPLTPLLRVVEWQAQRIDALRHDSGQYADGVAEGARRALADARKALGAV